MKETAVGDGGEPLGEFTDGQGIHPQEVHRHPPLGRLPPRYGERGVDEVDPRHGMAALGEPDRQVARAAADVEHPWPDPIGSSDERGLRPADVPRRLGLRVVVGEPVGRGRRVWRQVGRQRLAVG